jgi:subtilisin-like proprotein convertase family protein
MKPDAWKILLGIFCAGLLSAVPAAAGGALMFSNSNFIIINDSFSPPTIATPYPSTNLATGLAGQVVTKATVTLQGFSHEFPSDVDILLVGPQGQKAILMANVGGQDKYSVTNLTLTLDDDAMNSLPIYTNLVSGTFKPTNGYLATGNASLPFNFPSPAPPGTSNAVSSLSVFKNTDPNGTWNLFVVDDVGGDSGSISGGWSLTLFVAVQLQAVRDRTNIVISWPGSVTNATLQFSPALQSSIAWSNVTTTPILTSGRYTVTNPISAGSRFYRLTVH